MRTFLYMIVVAFSAHTTLAQIITALASATINPRAAATSAFNPNDPNDYCDDDSFQSCFGSYSPCEGGGEQINICFCTNIVSEIGCISNYCQKEFTEPEIMSPYYASSSTLCAGFSGGAAGAFAAASSIAAASAAASTTEAGAATTEGPETGPTAGNGGGPVATTTASKGAAAGGFAARDTVPVLMSGLLAGVVGLIGFFL